MNRGGTAFKLACLTVCGSGYMPLASGTWGSAASVLLALPLWLVPAVGGYPRAITEVGLVVGVLLATWASVAWGAWAIQRWGRTDPKQFVLDEFAGQWVALLWLPTTLGADWWSLVWLVGGQFFLFRVFDVIKLPPARQAERLPAGWGILVDDLVAGLQANVVGQVVWRLTPMASVLGVQLTAGGV